LGDPSKVIEPRRGDCDHR